MTLFKLTVLFIGAQNAQQRIPIGQLQGNVLLQQHDMHAIDGDKAFALSVTADMRALPEHARAIAKAQIQNWLDSSRLVPQMNFEVK